LSADSKVEKRMDRNDVIKGQEFGCGDDIIWT
jgi:hypothetical protein